MSFASKFASITQERASLAPFTHLRIGGPAEYLVTPQSRAELAQVVEECGRSKIPFRVLGIGTNILIRDEMIPGVVVRLTADAFTQVQVVGKKVVCGGGANLAQVIAVAAQGQLAGIETLVGITATIGGALRCNAGDRSGEIADHLIQIEVIDDKGQSKIREKNEIHFADHDSDIDDPVILSVEFGLENDVSSSILKRMRRAWILRKADQPLSHQSAIRAFKNPNGENAAHLIERAGLVRTKVGGAEVSDRNANYVVANPGTTAKDIVQLVAKMKQAVLDHTGIALEQEFKVW